MIAIFPVVFVEDIDAVFDRNNDNQEDHTQRTLILNPNNPIIPSVKMILMATTTSD